MTQVLLRYKVKPEHAAENEQLVRAVYEELQCTEPSGFHYATFQAGDSRGHRLPGGRVLGRRRRRDRGGSHPRPPPAQQAVRRRASSRPATPPARRHRSAPCHQRRFHPHRHLRVTPSQRSRS